MTGADDQQQVSASSSNVLVIAPPGCGKTEHLAARAESLVSEILPHQKILALTFSNRAKQNLSDRISAKMGRDQFRKYVTVRNFHGHAAEIVRSHGTTLGIPTSFDMPTKRTLPVALAEHARDGDDPKVANALLSNSKRAAISDEEVMQLLVQAGDQLAQRVEAGRIDAGQIHYDDLLRHAQRLLQNPVLSNLYKQHYGAVLVDEFQDLSVQQLEIALNSCDSRRIFVGDPLQGIYSWAGAQPTQVENHLRELCGEPLQMSTSYRSSPAVLNVLNVASSILGAANLTAANPAAWRDGGAAAALTFDTGTGEAAYVHAASSAIMKRDPEATIGVIVRGGWRRKPIDAHFLSTTGVDFLRWDLALEDPRIVELLQRAVGSLPTDTPLEGVRVAAENLVDPHDPDTLGMIRDAMDDLEESCEDMETLRSIVSNLQVRDPHAPIQSGVHLLNAHTGKGQQFDWVFIPGLEDFHIPSGQAKTPSEKAEEERVLLVMLSRARHGIIVSRANQLISKAGRPYPTRQSQWWESIAESCAMSKAELKAHILHTEVSA
ncbi:ATP-dependent helicase [Arthrobacter sp. C9C5]|uniref:UvrD-helicase domain-containing protein n=1 Tax=Arthrobacter sp. C9C5 TaxID=2735267 RepID=UPI0015857960|nr:ATP-dependent helicase [Arthrobacter sp. C9C5]NUU33081.1 ATP-dependent helicase [Arthrobacter sp. C9C5]